VEFVHSGDMWWAALAGCVKLVMNHYFSKDGGFFKLLKNYQFFKKDCAS
jgi:hypothetical protein